MPAFYFVIDDRREEALAARTVSDARAEVATRFPGYTPVSPGVRACLEASAPKTPAYSNGDYPVYNDAATDYARVIVDDAGPYAYVAEASPDASAPRAIPVFYVTVTAIKAAATGAGARALAALDGAATPEAERAILERFTADIAAVSDDEAREAAISALAYLDLAARFGVNP